MSLVTLNNAALHLGTKTIFEDLNLRVGEGERIGLIGPNGSGKTTILRLLAGNLVLDHGNVAMAKDLRIGYLPQDIELEGGVGLLEFVRRSIPGRQSIEQLVTDLEEELTTDIDEDRTIDLSVRLGEAHAQLADFETEYADHVALTILSGLGFADHEHDRDIAELSGGWKIRAVLASLLFMRPDLMLLDEPTNHLDMPSVAWFGSFLKNYRRSFILISHDREFINEQVNRVVSFEPEGVRSYPGNLDRYDRVRAEERDVLINRAKNMLREREQAEAFIKRFRASATKAKAVQSRVKALEKLDEVQVLTDHQRAQFRFPPCPKSSKISLKVDGLAKSYGEHSVLDDVTLQAERGQRIGVIGANGAGKTTLLKMIAGELASDKGRISFGHDVVMGYYAQHHADILEPSNSVLEEVSVGQDEKTPTQLRNTLGSLLFAGDDVEKSVGVLSGGERARVALAKILLRTTNVLLMDEPTNHLDLQSSEQLATALTHYEGAVIFVSHNRSFIRKVATQIWNVADRGVESYLGNLDDYMTSSMRRFELDGGQVDSVTKSSATAGNSRTGGQTNGKGLSKAAKKEQRRREAEQRRLRKEFVGPLEKKVAKLEARITEVEVSQKERGQLLADPEIFGDPVRSGELNRDYQSAEHELQKLNTDWEKTQLELEKALAQVEAQLS